MSAPQQTESFEEAIVDLKEQTFVPTGTPFGHGHIGGITGLPHVEHHHHDDKEKEHKHKHEHEHDGECHHEGEHKHHEGEHKHDEHPDTFQNFGDKFAGLSENNAGVQAGGRHHLI
ncbi:hypothetical protein BGZ46_008760 [Entomortierella lignicola]|nr:hypothetical protein BGZ46_008760 [Entomortierella lignicola]